jgi:hypothetical protein
MRMREHEFAEVKITLNEAGNRLDFAIRHGSRGAKLLTFPFPAEMRDKIASDARAFFSGRDDACLPELQKLLTTATAVATAHLLKIEAEAIRLDIGDKLEDLPWELAEVGDVGSTWGRYFRAVRLAKKFDPKPQRNGYSWRVFYDPQILDGQGRDHYRAIGCGHDEVAIGDGGAKEAFAQSIESNNILQIASHCERGEGNLAIVHAGGEFLNSRRQPFSISPRMVILDCCHSAETPIFSFRDLFSEGCMVFIGHIGEMRVDGGYGSRFAKLFARAFLSEKMTLAESVRAGRDTDNLRDYSAAVYVSKGARAGFASGDVFGITEESRKGPDRAGIAAIEAIEAIAARAAGTARAKIAARPLPAIALALAIAIALCLFMVWPGYFRGNSPAQTEGGAAAEMATAAAATASPQATTAAAANQQAAAATAATGQQTAAQQAATATASPPTTTAAAGQQAAAAPSSSAVPAPSPESGSSAAPAPSLEPVSSAAPALLASPSPAPSATAAPSPEYISSFSPEFLAARSPAPSSSAAPAPSSALTAAPTFSPSAAAVPTPARPASPVPPAAPSATPATAPAQADAVAFAGVEYTGGAHVAGTVRGASPGEYGVVLLVLVGSGSDAQFYIKPSLDGGVSGIGSDGSFDIQAYTDDGAAREADLTATMYSVFLVPESFDTSLMAGASDYGAVKANAVAALERQAIIREKPPAPTAKAPSAATAAAAANQQAAAATAATGQQAAAQQAAATQQTAATAASATATASPPTTTIPQATASPAPSSSAAPSRQQAAPAFGGVKYDGGFITGRASGFSSAEYGVAAMILVGGEYWVKPFFDGRAIHAIGADGSFSIQAYTEETKDADLAAAKYSLFVVPLSFDMSSMAHASDYAPLAGAAVLKLEHQAIAR